MRYVEPLAGFLAFLWFAIDSLLGGRGRRDWEQKAQVLLGLSGMALFGLVLYGRYSAGPQRFYFLKGFLGGLSVGIFITLWLEGSLNLLARLQKAGTGSTSDPESGGA